MGTTNQRLTGFDSSISALRGSDEPSYADCAVVVVGVLSVVYVAGCAVERFVGATCLQLQGRLFKLLLPFCSMTGKSGVSRVACHESA